MKKLLLTAFASGFLITGNAQAFTENTFIIDAAEDTTQVNTIKDIVLMQESVNSRNATETHFSNVWSRKSYFNPGYILSSKLSSKNDIPVNPDYNQKMTFKSKWGAQIQLGHSYTLHKGAIANMVQINLDYTYIDLSGNCYEKDPDLLGKYNANDTWKEDGSNNYTDGYWYQAWGEQKYNVNYGMSIGPSVTVAPFILMNSANLHYMKVNAYFHVGYNVGGLFYKHDYSYEQEPAKDPDTGESIPLNPDTGTVTDILWGHGLSLSYGLSLSWKSIGIGWENATANLKYQSTSPGSFGKTKYPFKNTTSRIYLTIRY